MIDPVDMITTFSHSRRANESRPKGTTLKASRGLPYAPQHAGRPNRLARQTKEKVEAHVS
jgi:hypothetical protein